MEEAVTTLVIYIGSDNTIIMVGYTDLTQEMLETHKDILKLGHLKKAY